MRHFRPGVRKNIFQLFIIFQLCCPQETIKKMFFEILNNNFMATAFVLSAHY